MVRLRILRWGGELSYLGGPNVLIHAPGKRRPCGQNQRGRGDKGNRGAGMMEDRRDTKPGPGGQS